MFFVTKGAHIDLSFDQKGNFLVKHIKFPLCLWLRHTKK